MTFEAARERWAAGERVPLYDPDDRIAWYVFQANAYAADRENWVEHEAYRIAPVFRRLGQLLPDLRRVGGIEERVGRLMTGGRKVPDDGIFELLVAGAYARRGWRQVAFVPEQRGGSRTPDLDVERGRSRWAVECKRVGQSDYGTLERVRAEDIAASAHVECERAGASLDIKIAFTDELAKVGDRYLADHVVAFLSGGPPGWKDDFGEGVILPIDWKSMRAVLRHDDVYFGSSRMIELLIGEYLPMLDYHVAGDWVPSDGRPFHATAMSRASVVSWISASDEAARRKARHFKSMVAGGPQDSSPATGPASSISAMKRRVGTASMGGVTSSISSNWRPLMPARRGFNGSTATI